LKTKRAAGVVALAVRVVVEALLMLEQWAVNVVADCVVVESVGGVLDCVVGVGGAGAVGASRQCWSLFVCIQQSTIHWLSKR
jgi:hypothetical protein